MAKLEHYIIIDDVSIDKCQMDSWRECLKDFNVLWIGINAPLNVLEEREQSRGDRMQGSARAQYFQVHRHMQYDFEFETHRDSIEYMVHQVMESYEASKSL